MGGSYYDLHEYDVLRSCREASGRHLRDVGMTYAAHGRHSLTLAWLLLVGAAQAVAHALVPAWCRTGTTDCVRRVDEVMKKRAVTNKTKVT